MADFTITNAELDNLNKALARLGARDFADIKTRYAINKMKRNSAASIAAMQDTAQSIADQYGKRDEHGHLIPAGNGGVELADGRGYTAAMKTLLAETTTLTGLRLLTCEELSVVPGSADELFWLGPLLAEPVADPL